MPTMPTMLNTSTVIGGRSASQVAYQAGTISPTKRAGCERKKISAAMVTTAITAKPMREFNGATSGVGSVPIKASVQPGIASSMPTKMACKYQAAVADSMR